MSAADGLAMTRLRILSFALALLSCAVSAACSNMTAASPVKDLLAVKDKSPRGAKASGAQDGSTIVPHKSRFREENGTASDSDKAAGSSRKQKLILHVGPHKTGTTAFQSWLRIHQGISPTVTYPKICGEIQSPVWYADLALGLCTNLDPAQLYRTRGLRKPWKCPPTVESALAGLKMQNKTSSDLIISSEAFSKCTPEKFARINDIFGPHFDLEVIIVRREPRSVLLSRWHQYNKHMKHMSYIEDDTLMNGDGRSSLCSYTSLRCLKALGGAFGPGKIHVVSYEGMAAVGKELAQVVCDIFSGSLDCYLTPRHDERYIGNVSPPNKFYSAATILNRFRLHAGCRATKHEQPNEKVGLFMEELVKAQVKEFCYPLSRLPSIDSDTRFHHAILVGSDRVISQLNRYYFKEGRARIESTNNKQTICQFSESAIYEDPGTFRAVAAAVRRLSRGCPRLKADGKQLLLR